MDDDNEKPAAACECPVCVAMAKIYSTHTERTLRDMIRDRDQKIADLLGRLVALGCTDKDVVP